MAFGIYDSRRPYKVAVQADSDEISARCKEVKDELKKIKSELERLEKSLFSPQVD